MKTRSTGSYVKTVFAGEEVAAFVPIALPPNPSVEVTDEMRFKLQMAQQNLARLELAGDMIPSMQWFIYAFVRKEAVLSSQIEGTQCTLVDLLNFEAKSHTANVEEVEIEEVCNYLDALKFAFSELRSPEGLPLSMRLLNGTHARLMAGVRGERMQPGELRRSQNWIGGSRPGNAYFVPAPPSYLPALLSDFERFIHIESDLHPLIRSALLHVQFETIHPYLDGNGRIGRLLVTLLFEEYGLLSSPLLYLSLYFKRHREEYYRRLSLVRRAGDWEGWVIFFLDAVAVIADEATSTARDMFALVAHDRAKLLGMKMSSITAVRLFERLLENPILTVGRVVEILQTTKPTAMKALLNLVEAGILEEGTGRQRGRAFYYNAYLNLLRQGTEL